MADASGGTNTSIYNLIKQPSAGDAITNMGKMADTAGNFAVGQAVQQGIDPSTGQIDPSTVSNLLKQSPVGAMKAIPTMNALQQLRQAGYAADQAGLDTFQKRMAVTSHLFSGLASKTNPTMDDVHDTAAAALDPALGAKQYGITMPVIMHMVGVLRKAFEAGGPTALRQKALEVQTQAASTSEILSEHNPQYQVIDTGKGKVVMPMGTAQNPNTGATLPNDLPPTTPVATPQGSRYLGPQPMQPGGGATDAQGQPLIPGGAPIQPGGLGPAATLRPGLGEAMQTVAAEGAKSFNALTAANDGSMGRKALLGNLDDMLGKFTPGKGADWSLVAKNFANRNVPMPDSWKKDGAVFDPKSIASQEEFNKQAMQLAQQQFASIGGTGTDAKFNSAFETSPNETLSALGNKGIVRLLKGNEDAIQAKFLAGQDWIDKHGADTYAKFSGQFNQHFDPRTFQFKYMSPQERQDYVSKMDPVEKDRMLRDIAYARKQGWVKY